MVFPDIYLFLRLHELKVILFLMRKGKIEHHHVPSLLNNPLYFYTILLPYCLIHVLKFSLFSNQFLCEERVSFLELKQLSDGI